MGSIVSAITGSGSSKAADAQATAAGEAIGIQQETLAQQIALAREALYVQQDMLDTALSLGAPYRGAGEQALAMYESLIYGIPLEQTASYQSLVYQRQVDEERRNFMRTLPAGAVENPASPGQGLYLDDQYHYRVNQDGSIDQVRRESNETWSPYRPEFTPTAQAPLPSQTYGVLDPMDIVRQTPGYQFRLDEGQKALERSAAARSGVLSGAQLKATERYGQDYATGEFNNLLNRLSGEINTGSQMAGAGGNQALSSAQMQSGILGDQAGYYGTYGENVGALTTQIGAARASGYLGQQEAGTNLLNNVFGAAGYAGGFGKLF
ncbi:MAG: hypothetical protein L0209_11720 [candidate division Zixibacteria bacterium]|nr:hypothetical protein [candidate division Zixibacteria bacterium]